MLINRLLLRQLSETCKIHPNHCSWFRFLSSGPESYYNKSYHKYHYNNRGIKLLKVGTTVAVSYIFYRKFFSFNNELEAAELHNEKPSSDNSVKSPRHVSNFIADIVEQVAPSVVSIEVQSSSEQMFFGVMQQQKSGGSGFIVKSDGLILTNAHVVQGSNRVIVTLHGGEKFEGVVEDYDTTTDLATVRIRAKNLPFIKLAESKKARPGEFVIAMGSPLFFSNSVTHGVISNTQRRMDGMFQKKSNMHYIQTDAPITFGNSGGPLVNMDGEAVAINNMTVAGFTGISFAIPSDFARKFLDRHENIPVKQKAQLPKNRRMRLGVTMLVLDPEITYELRAWNPNFPNIDHGLLVHSVEPKSLADKAGINPGDIITHVNNEPIFDPAQINDLLQNSKTVVKIRIWRDSKVEELSIDATS